MSEAIAKISQVLPESIADELGLTPGDSLVSINGTKMQDLIDYKFLCADEFLELEIVDIQGKKHKLEIEKDYDQDLGLEFETALFDGLIQCTNNCPFCFIDQQPPGKRNSLYLKDDDYRLSFLYGSYLTLTNLSQKHWRRIEQMRLSPLYVSVHATEPELRIRLLKNPRAGLIMEQLRWFQQRQLQIHTQIVVCPGINDSDHLERTILDLASFHQGEWPCVASIAVVPVGLTRFRPSEDSLTPVTKEIANKVIEQVQSLQKIFAKKHKSKVVWLADEWFLIAGKQLPKDYEDYPQIGNGVGSIGKFIEQFQAVARSRLPKKINSKRKLLWVVGNAVELAFEPLVAQLNEVEGLDIELVPLKSKYWGQEITVTGVLTGYDLLQGLAGRDLGDGILLPSVMLKHDEAKFLDDMTLEDIAQTLNSPIFPVEGVEKLIDACLA